MLAVTPQVPHPRLGGFLGLSHPHLVALLHLQQRNLFHHDEVEEPERGRGGGEGERERRDRVR